MHEYLFIFPITIALVLGVISPGPSFLLVAQTAMSHSRKKALFISLGMGIGAMVFAILAQTGVYILLKTLPRLFFIFEILGGLYLCYLAFSILKYAKKPLDTQIHLEKKVSLLRSFSLGLFTQLSNPKTAIIIGSIFAAFMPENAPILSYFLLALIAFCLDCGWYSIVAVTLSTQKAQKAYIKYKTLISYLSSCIMLGIGCKLLFSSFVGL